MQVTKKMKLDPKFRKELIIVAALQVADQDDGWKKMTREAVAKKAGCAEGTVSLHFSTMKQFRRAVMRAAIRREHLYIIGQGLAARDECAMKVDKALQHRALQALMS